MKISVLIACHGDQAWADLAWSRAYPSAFRQADECLVVYRKNATIAEARNEAAMNATGDWLVFLDADDELEPDYVETMRTYLAAAPEPEQLLAPRVSYVESGYKQEPKYWHHGYDDMLRSGNWLLIGTGVHRGVFDKAGGFREWPIYEDWDLWLRCVLHADAVPVKVPGMVYVAHVGHHSRNRSLPQEERDRVHHEIFSSNYGS